MLILSEKPHLSLEALQIVKIIVSDVAKFSSYSKETHSHQRRNAYIVLFKLWTQVPLAYFHYSFCCSII